MPRVTIHLKTSIPSPRLKTGPNGTADVVDNHCTRWQVTNSSFDPFRQRLDKRDRCTLNEFAPWSFVIARNSASKAYRLLVEEYDEPVFCERTCHEFFQKFLNRESSIEDKNLAEDYWREVHAKNARAFTYIRRNSSSIVSNRHFALNH
ncbi:hypothetical protein TNCV_3254691 [Trichonephila clavipes]|nr:hypothetical protein TNCV_3254691 [Trichonephila clavipes]